MASFHIADSTTELAVTDSQQTFTANLQITVRNLVDQVKTARMSVETDGDIEKSWFSFENAPPKNPQFLETDFMGDSSQTLGIKVNTAGTERALTGRFRLRLTAEDDPDNDFSLGPWVALTIPQRQQKSRKRPTWRFRWWYVAIVIALFLLGGAAFVAWAWL